MSRRYRPRVNFHLGCLGCSLPLLTVLGVIIAVLVLAACGGTSSPPAVPPSHQTTHQAAVSCKQLYDSWKTGPAKAVADRMVADLNRFSGAASNEDVTAADADLVKLTGVVRDLRAYPMPACADPHGYWAKILDEIQAAGDNAKSGSGLGGLMLAVAPLQKVKGYETKLTAELQADAKAAS